MLQDTIARMRAELDTLLSKLQTEEATKQSLVLPIISALGYDVEDPDQVLPEMTCDVGCKRGEKVDYALMIDGFPAILVECKPCGARLDSHVSQLFRYFATSTARFAILTNGVEYRFYTDTERENVMDLVPFSVFRLDLDTDPHIFSIFARESFDAHNIFDYAESCRFISKVQSWIRKEIDHPTDAFVAFAASNVIGRKARKQDVDHYRDAVQLALRGELPNIVHVSDFDGFRATAVETVVAYVRASCPGMELSVRETVRYIGIYPTEMPRTAICRLYFGKAGVLRRISLDNEAERLIVGKLGLEEYKKEIQKRAKSLL